MNRRVIGLAPVSHHAGARVVKGAHMDVQKDDAPDPLRQRVLKSVRFRPDDPPELREQLIREAMEAEQKTYRSSLGSYLG